MKKTSLLIIAQHTRNNNIYSHGRNISNVWLGEIHSCNSIRHRHLLVVDRHYPPLRQTDLTNHSTPAGFEFERQYGGEQTACCCFY